MDGAKLQIFAWDWQIYCVTALLAVVTLTLLTFSKKRGLKSEKVRKHPEKWCLVGRVAKLVVYPIKSCQGIQVKEAIVTKLGLKLRHHNIKDRDFMIVDIKGKPVTLVSQPALSFVTLEPSPDKEDHLIISAPGMDSITFTYPDARKSEEKFCQVEHDKKVRALDCGDQVAVWLQTFIGRDDLRLYFHHVQVTQRTFEPYMYQCPDYERSDMGSFHNETSYHLVGQESIDDLNAKLIENESSWKNFRPTILVEAMSEPFAELGWSFVKIGSENAILKASVPCSRCKSTTVDQEAGVLPTDGEPLKTLRKMGKASAISDPKLAELLKNKGIMGLRMGLYLPAGESAVVRVGDPIYAALM